MEDLRKNAINYGMYLGLILIAFNTIIYAVDINLFTNMWVGILTMIIMVSVAVFTTVKHKNKLGGFLSFKEAFSSFIITVIVGSLISVIYTIVLFNFIDPEAKTILTENLIKYTTGLMEKFGAKPADINEAVKEMSKTDSYGIYGQLKGYVSSIVIYSIIGLITALIIKRDRPLSL